MLISRAGERCFNCRAVNHSLSLRAGAGLCARTAGFLSPECELYSPAYAKTQSLLSSDVENQLTFNNHIITTCWLLGDASLDSFVERDCDLGFDISYLVFFLSFTVSSNFVWKRADYLTPTPGDLSLHHSGPVEMHVVMMISL